MPLNAYLTIPGFTGSGPGGSIQIESFSFGVSNSSTAGSGTGTGGSAGKVSLSDLTVTKTIDSSSPKFFDTALSSMVIASVVLKVYRPAGAGGGTGSEYLMITMNNVIISGYMLNDGTSGGQSPCPPFDAGEGRPKESISLNFESLSFQYMPQSGN